MFAHQPFRQRHRAASRGGEFCAFCSSCCLFTCYQGICATRLLEMVFLHQFVCCSRSSGCIAFALTVVSRPTGAVTAAILFAFLNLNPHQKRPIRDQLVEFDFIGLICLVAGIVSLLLGFDFSQTTCMWNLIAVVLRSGLMTWCLKGRT